MRLEENAITFRHADGILKKSFQIAERKREFMPKSQSVGRTIDGSSQRLNSIAALKRNREIYGDNATMVKDGLININYSARR